MRGTGVSSEQIERSQIERISGLRSGLASDGGSRISTRTSFSGPALSGRGTSTPTAPTVHRTTITGVVATPSAWNVRHEVTSPGPAWRQSRLAREPMRGQVGADVEPDEQGQDGDRSGRGGRRKQEECGRHVVDEVGGDHADERGHRGVHRVRRPIGTSRSMPSPARVPAQPHDDQRPHQHEDGEREGSPPRRGRATSSCAAPGRTRRAGSPRRAAGSHRSTPPARAISTATTTAAGNSGTAGASATSAASDVVAEVLAEPPPQHGELGRHPDERRPAASATRTPRRRGRCPRTPAGS